MAKTSRPKKSPEDDLKRSGNNFIKYTNIAIKMAVIILIGVFAGRKLDEWMAWDTPVFTLVLSLLSVAGAMYSVIKDLIRK